MQSCLACININLETRIIERLRLEQITAIHLVQQSSLLKQGHQDKVQMAFEYLQGAAWHTVSGQSVPGLHRAYSYKCFMWFKRNIPHFCLCPLILVLSLNTTGKGPTLLCRLPSNHNEFGLPGPFLRSSFPAVWPPVYIVMQVCYLPGIILHFTF